MNKKFKDFPIVCLMFHTIEMDNRGLDAPPLAELAATDIPNPHRWVPEMAQVEILVGRFVGKTMQQICPKCVKQYQDVKPEDNALEWLACPVDDLAIDMCRELGIPEKPINQLMEEYFDGDLANDLFNQAFV